MASQLEVCERKVPAKLNKVATEEEDKPGKGIGKLLHSLFAKKYKK